MLIINREFVMKWVKIHDEKFKGGDSLKRENKVRAWLAQQPEPKFFDKSHFIELANWKSKRPKRHYENNNENLIKETTRLASTAVDEHLKLHILKVLDGVGVPVASTLLHFMQPNTFPIFDIRVRKSLKKAGKWARCVEDASDEAWLEYIQIIRGLSKTLNLGIRDLDKALWAYDKWQDKI